MNKIKLYYNIAITVFTITILCLVGDSYINYDSTVLKFEQLGYPSYLIHLLGLAQISGLIMVLLNKGKWLLEWAYAGFFMNFTFGIVAHLLSKDGNGATAVFCLILIGITYLQKRKLKNYTDSLTIENNTEAHHLKKVA